MGEDWQDDEPPLSRGEYALIAITGALGAIALAGQALALLRWVATL